MLPQRVYAEINLDAICRNVQNAMDKVGNDTKIMAIIKTNAYGHGAVQVARALDSIGTYAFGVATVEEALVLRRNQIKNPILILGYVFAEDFGKLIENDVMHAVFQYETAAELSRQAVKLGKTAKIHIKIDTGMGRIGFQPTQTSLNEIVKISKLPNIEINGIFTHFACADEKEKTSCLNQKKKFLDFVAEVENSGVSVPVKHMCNSAAIIEFNGDFLDMARSGIMTYGLYPSQEVDKTKLELYPAMSLISHIAFVKKVPSGFTVSYGSTFTTSCDSEIATVPVGYGDGYPRSLSNKGRVIVNGSYAPIVGRVCMDQIMIDVTGLGVKQGDKVTLVGSDAGKSISVEEVADAAYSFNYEFCCSINMRVPRVFIRNGEVTAVEDYLDKM